MSRDLDLEILTCGSCVNSENTAVTPPAVLKQCGDAQEVVLGKRDRGGWYTGYEYMGGASVEGKFKQEDKRTAVVQHVYVTDTENSLTAVYS